MYTLSYFMARIVSDLPMKLVVPTIFAVILYWMAGLRLEIEAFVLTLMVPLGYVLVAQGLGLALGATIMDATQASKEKRSIHSFSKMRRGEYADSSVNPMAAAQMQHMSALRLQHNSSMNHYPGRDSLRADEEHQYMSSRAEGQWQWDRDGPKESLSSHMYKEGQGNDASRSLFQGQRSDTKSSLEKQGNKDPRVQAHQNDMEVGYDDNTLPQTFEGLEQKFLQDITKLTKELQDAEDTENARHRERLNEINTQYQEKLLAIRARQATHREEFLHKESQARHQQYQQANMNTYQSSAGPSDAYGYGSAAAAASAMGDAHRAYAAGHFDNYGEQPDSIRGARGHGFEHRGQYPGGRAYNSGGRYY